MKKFLIICFVVLIGISVNAADALKVEVKDAKVGNKITGAIVDKITGEALAGVEVKLIGTDIKIYSDLDGKFEIEDVKAGAQAIQVEYISYQNIVENVFVSANETTDVTLKLKSVIK